VENMSSALYAITHLLWYTDEEGASNHSSTRWVVMILVV
jgi:hypothetical protein